MTLKHTSARSIILNPLQHKTSPNINTHPPNIKVEQPVTTMPTPQTILFWDHRKMTTPMISTKSVTIIIQILKWTL